MTTIREKVAWLKPVARFVYYWVRSDGSIEAKEQEAGC